MERKSLVRLVLTVLSVSVCVDGFGWLVWEQVFKFFAKRTSVAVSYTNSKWHRVPLVVFCSRDAYLPNATWSKAATREGYSSVIRAPDVEWKGVARDEFAEYETSSGGFSRPIDTFYNGRCAKFELDSRLPTGSYMWFWVGGGAVDVFLIHPGEEIFVMWQNWGFSSVSHAEVDRTTVLGLFPNHYYFLEDPRGLDCRGGREQSHLTDCIRGKFGRALAEADLECLPVQVLSIMDDAYDIIPACEMGQENVSELAIQITSRVLSAVSESCHIPCRITLFPIRSQVPLAPISGGPFSDPEGRYFSLFLHFPSHVETHREQYFVHDLPSIVSAVGGALGLFLGFSCLSLLSKMVAKALDEDDGETDSSA